MRVCMQIRRSDMAPGDHKVALRLEIILLL